MEKMARYREEGQEIGGKAMWRREKTKGGTRTGAAEVQASRSSGLFFEEGPM